MDTEKNSDSSSYGAEEEQLALAESQILTGRKLAVVFCAILLSTVLIALDQTILATALPRIASDFGSFHLQAWMSDSYLLAQTVFLLIHGKLLRIFSAKWVLVSGITLFGIGSLVCGLAQNVNQIIAGRTVSGMGAAAICAPPFPSVIIRESDCNASALEFVSMLQVISQATRLQDRPRLFGIFSALYGLSSVIGPLMGGAFVDHVTWRWVFFINLPIGGVSLLVVLISLPNAPPLGSDPATRSPKALLKQVLHMDFVGAVLVSASVTCLVIALQWGGNTKPWDDAAVIICFVFSGVAALAFVLWERYLGDGALAPMSIFKSRSVYGAMACAFLTRFSLLLFSYYLPIFYQAARHSSATRSGIDLLPLVLSSALTSLICAQIVSLIGYYWPFLAIAPVFLGLGSGLLYSLEVDTPEARLVGFQILAGIGIGLGLQNSLLVLSVEFKDDLKLVGQAMSMASFSQFLGGTLGLGVAEPVFASELTKYLRLYAPDAPLSIVRESPTAIYTALPAGMVPGVVRAYTASLKIVFLLGVPVAVLGLVAVAFINNLKIEKQKPGAGAKEHEP
ncbi:ABC transporter [Mycena polygramma]|nr:ABC transporter [Mycena polygramma]